MSTKHLCAYLILVVFSSVSYCDINVLQNPGFENGTPSDWEAYYGYYGINTIGVTTSQVRSGNYAGRIYNSYWRSGITQDLSDKIAYGENYTVSAWIKTNTTSSYSFRMYLVYTDWNGTFNITLDTANVNNSGWVELSGNFQLIPSSSLSEAYLLISCSSPVEFYIDDANVFGPESPPPAGQVNANIRRQVLEGFGASGAWEEDDVSNHDAGQRDEIYDLLFIDSGLDIYRDRNTYGYATGRLYNTGVIVAEAKERNPDLKVMISSWSPPRNLKSNGTETDGGTLLKDGSGNYMYDEFAQWWLDSLNLYSSLGVEADYISIQNEPNYVDTWETCLFDPYENPSVAGYNIAFETVWQKLNAEMGSAMPKMIAPEGRGTWLTYDYIYNIIDISHVYGYAHHLYGDTSAYYPNRANENMISMRQNFGDKPRMQTEFSNGDSATTWADAMYLANLMHNSLVLEEVSVYLYWELFWSSNKGLVKVTTSTYAIHPVYYAFKHFARFTDPLWQRVDTFSNRTSNLISAYISPDERQLTVVILNTSSHDTELDMSFDGFDIAGGDIYQSNSESQFEFIGNYDSNSPITLPAFSITTLALGNADYYEPPQPPTGLTATPQSERVLLDWNDNIEEDFAGYNLYRSITSGSGYVKLNDQLITDSNYIDDNVVPGVTYYYVVTALDIISNESDFSVEAPADAFDTTAPSAPAGLVASPATATVLLDWDDNSEEDLAGYNVYRSTTSGSGYEKINPSLLTDSTYTDNSVINETIYYYVVTALDFVANESGGSNEVVVKPGVADYIYNFAQITAADLNNNVFACDVDVFPFLGLSANRNTMVEATDEQYAAVSAVDANRWTTVDPGLSDEIFLWVEMEIDEPASEIGRIELTFNGHTAGSASVPHSIYVLKAGADWTQTNSWVQLGTLNIPGGTDGELTVFIGFDIQTYIDANGIITWGVDEDTSSESMRINYLQAAVYMSLFDYKTCSDIQLTGMGLVSDLNGDCYVNFQDLEILAGYWLKTDCDTSSDCEGADFAPTDGDVDFIDYSDFALNWMVCNNPADANCISNFLLIEQ
ncbi:MAG: carbohydrate binding domain-containing protein [Phycisphaerae bacterium]